MPQKQDLLAICNEFGVPVQDFEAQHCSRCLQPECNRSQHGKSRFEARIDTWQERLFTHVPRMPESDPRLVQLRTTKFIEVSTGRTPEVGSNWMDPRDLDEAPATHQAASVPAEPEPEPPSVAPPPLSVETKVAVEPPEPRPEPRRPAPRQLLNTPSTNGRMIGGRKPETPNDPWEVKPKETQGLKVVQPGARIKLGSGV